VVILSRGRVKKQAPFATLAKLSMDELYQHGAGE
jgi:ATP-binding cassette subfamily B protein/subfamily B ATP-binding cassette protein MsbA